MPAQVKLLGPDLGQPLIVEVDPSDTVAGLKDRALEKWPAGACCTHPKNPSPLLLRAAAPQITR